MLERNHDINVPKRFHRQNRDWNCSTSAIEKQVKQKFTPRFLQKTIFAPKKVPHVETFFPQISAALKVGLFGLREVTGWVTFENSAWTPGGLWIHLGKSRCGLRVRVRVGIGWIFREAEPLIYTPRKTNWHNHWKSMVGKCIFYWNSPFLVDMSGKRSELLGNLQLICFIQGRKTILVLLDILDSQISACWIFVQKTSSFFVAAGVSSRFQANFARVESHQWKVVG